MDHLLTVEFFTALIQVIFIDIALAADNAVVIGMAAAGLAPADRKKAIFWGIVAATVMRIAFASVTVQLLQIVGLVLAGGILLLWVCWKMWSELHPEGTRAAFRAWRNNETLPGGPQVADGPGDAAAGEGKTLRQAVIQIVIADLSMSLDNVLAVAGAAREHMVALVIGLGLSIAMMGMAAMMIARMLEKHRWIAYLGFLVVLYVALRMIWEGSHEVIEVAHLM